MMSTHPTARWDARRTDRRNANNTSGGHVLVFEHPREAALASMLDAHVPVGAVHQAPGGSGPGSGYPRGSATAHAGRRRLAVRFGCPSCWQACGQCDPSPIQRRDDNPERRSLRVEKSGSQPPARAGRRYATSADAFRIVLHEASGRDAYRVRPPPQRGRQRRLHIHSSGKPGAIANEPRVGGATGEGSGSRMRGRCPQPFGSPDR
jgi:hypothetical protein